MTDTRRRIIDVRPAMVSSPPLGIHTGAGRVITDGDRLVVLLGPDERREFKVTRIEEDKRRRRFVATVESGEGITFGQGGGCTCGKRNAWLRTSPVDELPG